MRPKNKWTQITAEQWERWASERGGSEIARLMGVHPQTVSAWWTNKRIPPAKVQKKIAALLEKETQAPPAEQQAAEQQATDKPRRRPKRASAGAGAGTGRPSEGKLVLLKDSRYRVRIAGVTPLLLESPSARARGATNPEAHVLRDDQGALCLSAIQVGGAISQAAARVVAPDMPGLDCARLFLQSVLVEEPEVRVRDTRGRKRSEWPEVKYGVYPCLRDWTMRFHLTVTSPIVDQQILKAVLERAGQTVGLGAYAPHHGRFELVDLVQEVQGEAPARSKQDGELIGV